MDNYIDSTARVQSVLDALAAHRVVTVFGLPLAGKSALAHEVARRLDEEVVVLQDLPPAPPACDLVLVDGADHWSEEQVAQLVQFANTQRPRWLLTRRSRLDTPVEASILAGRLPGPDADRLLRTFLERRDCETSAIDRRRLLTVVTPLPGVLFAAAKLIEVHGVSAVRDRWAQFDPLVRALSVEVVENLDDATLDAARTAGCFGQPFDAVAFEDVSRLSASTLTRLLDLGYVERVVVDDGPPQFELLPAVRAVVGHAAPRTIQRHARWVAEHGGRTELLALVRRVAVQELEVDPGILVDATLRLCEGPLPPASLVDAAIDAARASSHPDSGALLCARARIALRDGEPHHAADYITEAEERQGPQMALHAVRAQIARVLATPDDALREYEEALAHDMPEDMLLEYAATLWESGEHEVARDATERALMRAKESGDRRREGIIHSNLGVMTHHAGLLDEARSMHEMALSIHEEVGHQRFIAIAIFDLATLDHEQGAVRRAHLGYERSIALLELERDRRLADLVRAADEAARAQIGLTAQWPIDELIHRFESVGDATLTEAALLYRDVITHLREGSAPSINVDEYSGRPDEVQLPARLLHRLKCAHSSGEVLRVATDRENFELDGITSCIGGRDALRNTFELLVEARLQGRDPVALEEIIAAGWPDEVVTEEAAKNRAHVALSTLRRMGLRPVLRTVDGGYRLEALICDRQALSPGP